MVDVAEAVAEQIAKLEEKPTPKSIAQIAGPPMPPGASADPIAKRFAPVPVSTPQSKSVAISEDWIGSPVDNRKIQDLISQSGNHCTRVRSMRSYPGKVLIIAEINVGGRA